MFKKIITTLAVAALTAFSSVSVSAAAIPSSGATTIYPNKLTITWANGSKASETIDTFRFYGYNVAQLRTMLGVLGGTVNIRQDDTYQVFADAPSVSHMDIGFKTQRDVKYVINQTQIRDVTGAMMNPKEPGWVFLPEYNYNWGSVRDVIQAMGLSLVSVDDNPAAGTTTVVVS